MTYFEGQEDLDFTFGTPPSVIQSPVGINFLSNARCALFAPGIVSFCKSTPFAPQSSLWLTAQVNLSATVGPTILFGVMDSATASSGIYVGLASGGVHFKTAIFQYDGTTKTQLAAESGQSFVLGLLLKLDINIINYGISSTINVYIAGNLVVSFSGNSTISGVTKFDTVVFCSDPSGNGNAYMSGMIVANEDTRTFYVSTRVPTAFGDQNQWSGAVADISEIVINDATVNSVNSTGQNQMYTQTSQPTGNYLIKALTISTRTSETLVTVPTQIALGVKSGGVLNAGTPQTQTTAWQNARRQMPVDPTTSAVWSVGSANAVQVNLQSD